ncbi:beta-lactamase-like protein [Chytriomyces sp. MP71]|nr:beta-lactamase-like protein [Chytriomyces sp. MP71]
MDVTFLGTASAQPSHTRSHSALALRVDGEVWLVDCGEATQHQLIHLNGNAALHCPDPASTAHPPASAPTPRADEAVLTPPRIARIRRVFITHLHGDHAFGLPGLLCTAGATGFTSETGPDPLHVYGPKGLKNYLRNALDHSLSRIGRKFVLHELILPAHVPSPLDAALELRSDSKHTAPHIDELPGEDLLATSLTSPDSNYPGDWYWTVITGNDLSKTGGASRVSVKAAPIPHSVPTVGYLFTEPQQQGKLRADLATPILQRNKDALGLKNPLVLLQKLKLGETLTMPDGAVLDPANLVEPARRGRRLLILGDTSDALSSAFVPLVDALRIQDASTPIAFTLDMVIHEATNACLAADVEAGGTLESVEKQTREHGHSTPQMAGAFSKRVNAMRLVLNHFSSRYKGDDAPESLAVMEEVRKLAVGEFGREQVVCARDFMNVIVKA